MLVTFSNVLIIYLLAVIGMMTGQIGLVCHKVLPCGDNEKEKPVFRKKNFNNEFNIWYGIPTMMILPLLYLKYNISLEFIAYSILSVVLVPVATVDYKHCIIPDKLNLFIFVEGLIYAVCLFILKQNQLAVNHLLGGLIGGGIFLFLALISFVLYRKEGMGFGDVKLMTGLGLFFGIKGILVLTLIAFAIGAVICIVLIASKRKTMKDYIPFGPFIILAAYILMFVPAGFFVDWYINMLK